MLPETKQAYEQQQQPTQQPLFIYDPQEEYRKQPYIPPPQIYKEPEDDWRTFILDERIWSPLFFVRPGIGYVRKLQTCYKQLLKEKAYSRLYDVNELLEKYNGLYHDYKALEVNLAVANAKLLHQTEQTEIALGMSTKAQKRNKVLKDHDYEEETSDREKVDNKYVSANGNSGKENQMMIAAMDAYGIPKDVISEELQIKKTSVVTIASSMKKEYMTVNNEEGFCICFGDNFDKTVWNLDEMFADDWWRDEKGKAHTREQEPDDEEYDDFEDEEEGDFEEAATSGRGVIMKGLLKY